MGVYFYVSVVTGMLQKGGCFWWNVCKENDYFYVKHGMSVEVMCYILCHLVIVFLFAIEFILV